MGNGNSEQVGAVLDTVILKTVRMAELASFYGEGLQLGEPSATGDDHLGYRMPGAYLGFDRILDESTYIYPGAVELWFEVDDLDATYAAMSESGAAVKYEPQDKPWGARLAALFDPDGNVVGLAQRGSIPDREG